MCPVLIEYSMHAWRESYWGESLLMELEIIGLERTCRMWKDNYDHAAFQNTWI